MTEAPAAPVPKPEITREIRISIADQSEAAMRRLREFINRSAAQHLRAMKREWAAREARA